MNKRSQNIRLVRQHLPIKFWKFIMEVGFLKYWNSIQDMEFTVHKQQGQFAGKFIKVSWNKINV